MKLPDKVKSKSLGEIGNDIFENVPEEELDNSITVFVEEEETIPMFSNQFKSEDILVKSIEKIIRKSLEYRKYIGILKTEFDLSKCKFITKVDLESKVGLEMHHYPFTLFDITKGVLRGLYGEPHPSTGLYSENVNVFKVADTVMKLHYEGKIGIVPLSLTVHELAHNGRIFIPLTDKYVFGNWRDLLEDEEIKFSNDVIKNVNRADEVTNDIVKGNIENDLSALDSINTIIKHSTFDELPNMISLNVNEIA